MTRKVIYGLLISIFIFFVIRNLYKKNLLMQDHGVGIAKIIAYNKSYRGGLGLTYIFDVKGKQYKSSIGQPDIGGDNGDIFLDKSFPVVYEVNNPKNNELLVRPDQFEKYQIQFPDSLGWVQKYLR